jgi:hypothetical protein
MLLYKYFRVINNVIGDLSLFIVQKSLKTKYNGELYSYLFILDNKNHDIKELNTILINKESTYSFPCYLETLWSFDEKTVTVTWIEAKKEYKNKGLSSFLLICAAYIADTFRLEIFELDDASDNFRKPNNLYTKLSFRYIEDGFPEMLGRTKHIIRKWRHIKYKYYFNFDIFKSLIPRKNN